MLTGTPLAYAKGAACTNRSMTLPLKNVSLAEWFNSDKENANDEKIKSALQARIQVRVDQLVDGWAERRGGSNNAGSG